VHYFLIIQLPGVNYSTYTSYHTSGHCTDDVFQNICQVFQLCQCVMCQLPESVHLSTVQQQRLVIAKLLVYLLQEQRCYYITSKKCYVAFKLQNQFTDTVCVRLRGRESERKTVCCLYIRCNFVAKTWK